jgi:putative molybdopterin biosynthesis protein
MSEQDQFLDVIDRDEAQRRFEASFRLEPLGIETVSLSEAWGRVLAVDVVSPVDVPSFDRSNFDGFALQARDTYGADEESPRRLRLLPPILHAGQIPDVTVRPGEAVTISTGAMLPRGADAVLMVEHGEVDRRTLAEDGGKREDGGDGGAGEDGEEGGLRSELLARRACPPGFGVTFAGTDISAGETVLWRGELLTSRETGVLAAIGVAEVSVWRRPRVAIISTGTELCPPGRPMQPGQIYDSNSRIVADAVLELGGLPMVMGIVADDLAKLREMVQTALAQADVILLSGGTSKGQGDLSYRVIRERTDPGVVAHGVALKPGKPICLAASEGKPIVILPGFPTSAIFTFHEFVAPVIRRLAGRAGEPSKRLPARLAIKVNSEIGRTEYVLVGLVRDEEATDGGPESLVAYPMGKGSGSVTAFSRADGFVTIPRHEELVESGSRVEVQRLGRDLRAADLVVIGSHCLGLDFLLGELQLRGQLTKFLAVGSTAGLDAARRAECDLAGIHLLDADTGRYNSPFVTDDLLLIPGYGRVQGIVFRPGDGRLDQQSLEEILDRVRRDPDCMMVNRNQGSGTRILIDQLLSGFQPAGYGVQARNHNAVAAAVAQGRADWGVAIAHAAQRQDLGFLPLTEERFDFVVPRRRAERSAVKAFQSLLQNETIQRQLEQLGFVFSRQPSE